MPRALHRRVEAEHEEHRVDVGRHDLLFGLAAGDLPREPALPRQHRADHGAAAGRVRPERDPVADGRQLRAASAARYFIRPAASASHSPLLGQHAVDVVVLERDASRDEASLALAGKGLRERVRPAERVEVRHRRIDDWRVHQACDLRPSWRVPIFVANGTATSHFRPIARHFVRTWDAVWVAERWTRPLNGIHLSRKRVPRSVRRAAWMGKALCSSILRRLQELARSFA